MPLSTPSPTTCLHGRNTTHASTGTADLFERANGRLYLSADFALPRDLEPEDKIALAHAFAQELAADERLPYTLAVHAGHDAEGREHNPHAHLMISERRNDGGLRLTGPEGQSEVAELLGHISEDWELSFDETGASIKAAYDPDSRVWLGRHDSFDIYPPVGLSSEAARDKRSSVGPYRALAAVWEHMILGPPADDDDPEGR